MSDIRDLKGLMPTGADLNIWILVVLALTVVSIGGLVWLAFRNKKKPAIINVLSPEQEALKRLNELLHGSLLEKGKEKQFHFILSKLFRTYLERRYSVPATDRTFDELKPLIKKLPLEENIRQQIEKILIETDLVKFTDYKQGINAGKSLCEIAISWIESVETELNDQKSERSANSTTELTNEHAGKYWSKHEAFKS